MERIAWLAGEVITGVLVAGVVVAAGLGASIEAGYPAAPWMVWAGLAGCVAAAVAVVETVRRSRNHSARLR